MSASDGPDVATVYIGLGSNLGDRLRALKEAVSHLQASGLEIEVASPVFETEPVDCEGPHFLNAVVRARTSLAPSDLLALLLRTEGRMGPERVKGPRRPRAIDLDLLLYDDMILSHGDLQVPHPRMTLRRFVLEPLSRLAPDLVVPGQAETVAVLAKNLAVSAPEQAVILVESPSLDRKADG